MGCLPYFSSICANNWVFELFYSVPVLTSRLPFWSGSCRREAARLSLQHGRDKLQYIPHFWLVNTSNTGFSLVRPATTQTSVNCSALRKSLHWAPDCLPHEHTALIGQKYSALASDWLLTHHPHAAAFHHWPAPAPGGLGWGQGSGSHREGRLIKFMTRGPFHVA